MIVEGTSAPDFSLRNENGDPVSLADYRGHTIVLYFYPQDDTPGCTVEACDFRDQHAAFRALDAVVLGVSRDTARSHTRFREKYQLPFTLLADTDLTVHRLYDVLVDKKMFGKPVKGTRRSTFIIDGAGIVRRAMYDVDPEGHVTEVKAALETLHLAK